MIDYSDANMSEFASRLRQERERLGLTLQEFGALGQVNRMTQMRYESGASSPTVAYLGLIGQHDVDIIFLLTGLGPSELIPLRDMTAFSKAIDLVDNIAKTHGVELPAPFRIRSILRIYEKILKFGVKKVNPALADLLHENS